MNRTATAGFGAALTGLVVCATPAIGQDAASRLNRHRGAVGSVSRTDSATAVVVTNVFAQCIAQRESTPVRKALDLPIGTAEQSKALTGRTEQFDGCLGVSQDFDAVSFRPILMVGGAAEYFLKSGLKRVDLSPLSGMTDEVLAKTPFAPRNGLEDLGLCVVRRNLERAREFVMSRISTQEEDAAFRAIAPDVGPCVTVGTDMKINRPNLRALLAFALYRVADKLSKSDA